MRPRVFVTRRLPDEAIEALRSVSDVDVFGSADDVIPRAELLRRVQGVAGILSLLTERIDEEVMSAAGPSLCVVANMAVGYDNIDVAYARAHGIVVCNTPDVLNETTADLTFALLIAAARRIVEADNFLRAGNWQTWNPMLLVGTDIFAATLGIIGMGRIGRAVARRARGFGMKVLYHNRRPDEIAEAETGACYSELPQLLKVADFIVVMVPLTAETEGMIGKTEFAMMKPTAIFVNTSRGAVVDENALVDALAQGRIRGAGLDVYKQEPIGPDHPLCSLANVVLLPHIGSASIATRTRMATLAAENIVSVLSHREALTKVF